MIVLYVLSVVIGFVYVCYATYIDWVNTGKFTVADLFTFLLLTFLSIIPIGNIILISTIAMYYQHDLVIFKRGKK